MARTSAVRASWACLALSGLAVTAAPAARAQSVSNAACLHSYEAAQRFRLQKKLRESKKSLLVCQNLDCPSALRGDCTTWLAEVDTAIPTLVVTARAGTTDLRELSVSMDGEVIADELDGSAIAVDPGEHTFRFEAPGRAPIERKLDLKAGEKNRAVELDFPVSGGEPGHARPNFIPVYGLAAIGVLGIGSFAFFGLRSHSRKGDLEACKGHCPVDDVHAVRRDQIVADISLAIGLVGLGTAAYLFYQKTKPSAEAPPTAHFRFDIRPSKHATLGVFAGDF